MRRRGPQEIARNKPRCLDDPRPQWIAPTAIPFYRGEWLEVTWMLNALLVDWQEWASVQSWE
jgi:hypothetical protein